MILRTSSAGHLMEFRRLGTEEFKPSNSEEIIALDSAFQRVWNLIKASGEASHLDNEVAQSSVAMHVLAVSQECENDVPRMADLAMSRFRVEQARYEAAVRSEKKSEIS